MNEDMIKKSKAIEGVIERIKERYKNGKRNYAHHNKTWPDNWANKETNWQKSPR